MKHVFSSAYDVAHLWAHQLQSNARCSNTSLYFDGNTIYSYGTHFPVGKIVENKRGEKAYLFNPDFYSVSTSKHQSVVDGAIPCDALTFHVSGCVSPGVYSKKHGYMCYYKNAIIPVVNKLETLIELIGKQKRARFNNYQSEILKNVTELYRWVKFWELNKPQKWYAGLKDIGHHRYEYVYKTNPTVDKFFSSVRYWQPFCEDAHLEMGMEKFAECVSLFRYLNSLGIINNGIGVYHANLVDMLVAFLYGNEAKNDVEKNKKSMKAAYKREEAKKRKLEQEEEERRIENLKNDYAKEKEQLDKWHKGEIREFWPNAIAEFDGWNAALRINDGRIETSKYIFLSMEEAKRLWTVVKAFENGHQFQHELALDMNGHRWAFNRYENHILTAGCHKIPFSECERIANLMGW